MFCVEPKKKHRRRVDMNIKLSLSKYKIISHYTIQDTFHNYIKYLPQFSQSEGTFTC